MSEITEVKFARLEGKMDNLIEKINHINNTLEKDYMTLDAFTIKMAPYEVQRKLFLFVGGAVALQIIGLGFFVLQKIISKGL